jgi:DNA-binding transcriptional regulator YdaS (Cro superfamily)
MDKQTAIKRAGSVRKLAALLGISCQAVYKWPEDAVPPAQLVRLRQMKTHWFRKQEAAQ